MGQEKFEVEFNFGNQNFLFDLQLYASKQLQELKKNMSLFTNYSQINEQILSYLMLNGYKESFSQLKNVLKYDKSFKALMNNKESQGAQAQRKNSRRKSSFTMDFELSSRRSIRKDSEVGARKQSLVRAELLMNNENEEVMKLLKLRYEVRTLLEKGQIDQTENFLIKHFSYLPALNPKIDHQLKLQKIVEILAQNDTEAFTLMKGENMSQIAPVISEDGQKRRVKFGEYLPTLLMKKDLQEFAMEQRMVTFEVINQLILESMNYLAFDFIDIMKYQENMMNEIISEDVDKKSHKRTF